MSRARDIEILTEALALECGNTSMLAALADDLDFELAATKLDGRFADKAEDPAIKALFHEFSRGAAGHVRGPRRVRELTRSETAPVLFFCPPCGWQLDSGPDPDEGAEAKCRLCPGTFALRPVNGDWTLDRLAP